MRRNIGSGYASEDEYGYSRAVRVGNQVFMSGTTARGAALSLDAYGQAKDAMATIEKALAEAGASLADVVKTVSYLTDMANIDGLTRAHSEAFDAIRPASTVLEITGLSPSEALVEIDVMAVVDSDA